MVGAIGEPHRLQGPLSQAIDGVALGVEQRQLDVLESAHAGQEMKGLEDEPDPLVAQLRPLVQAQPRGVAAVQEEAPLVGLVQKTEHVHEGGLARARRADEGQELAPLDLEGHIIQGADGPASRAGVGPADSRDFDHVCSFYGRRVASALSRPTRIVSPSSRPSTISQ